MDPRVRLDRRYPGQGLAEPPAVAVRLLARDREARPARALPGDQLKARGDVKVRRPGRLANPAPNAPLLKRIVRYPYREHTAHPRRLRVFEAIVPKHERFERTPAIQIVRDLRDPIALGNPLRVIRSAPEPRVRPTVDQWLKGRP